MQLRILRLRLLQDGNVRISILPQREEILIRRAGFGSVALQLVSAGEAETGQRSPRKVGHRHPAFPGYDSGKSSALNIVPVLFCLQSLYSAGAEITGQVTSQVRQIQIPERTLSAMDIANEAPSTPFAPPRAF